MHCCTGECVGKVAVRVLISLASTEIDYTKLVLAWYPSHRNSESVGPPRPPVSTPSWLEQATSYSLMSQPMMIDLARVLSVALR